MAFPTSGLFVATFVDALDTTQLALDLDLDTHKVALYTNSITGADLTSDVGYGAGAWASNEVPNGSGYTTGGATLTGTTFAHVSGGSCAFDATDSSWAAASFTARGCLVYADALGSNNGILAVNFGADYTATAGTFLVSWNASGLFTIDFNP